MNKDYVYQLINDINGEIMYVGVTNNPQRRLREHIKSKNLDSSTVTMEIVSRNGDRVTSLREEKDLIKVTGAPLNKNVSDKSLSNLTPRAFTSLGPTRVMRIPQIVSNDIHTIISHLDRIHKDEPAKMERVLENLLDTLSDL